MNKLHDSHPIRSASALLAALLCGGCITLGNAPEAIYSPDYQVLDGTVNAGGGTKVFVEGTVASDLYDDPTMIIRSAGGLVEKRGDSEWAEKPQDLVTRTLREHFLASDRFGYAVHSSSDAQLRVRPILRRFDEEHDGGWSAVFAIDIEVENGDRQPIAYLRLPEVRKAAATADPAGVSQAMAAAMREGLDQAVEAVASVQGR